MSKKPQKPQNPNNPKKPQIVDQQNQPFLRTIAKRIRNINKKLTEIDELKKKDDLKPEQTEKVNRRGEYEAQKTKLEGIADFFRETYAENFEQYRNNQLQELDQLANAIAVLRGSANFKEAEKLSELNKALTASSDLSLTESAKNVSEILRKFAGDFKLKKTLEALVAENQVAKQPEQKPAHQPVPEPVQEAKVEEPKQEVPPVIVQQPPVVEDKPAQQEAPVQEPVATEPVAQEQSTQQAGEQKPTEEGEHKQSRGNNRGYRGQKDNRGPRQDRPPRQNRGLREYKGPREDRGPRENRGPRGEGKEGGERRRYDPDHPNRQRPNYRPKNQEEEGSGSDSSLEREQVVRTWKREEIKQLENDGFTVVGKPKPKAKEGQKEWHEKTHGRKQHHHNQPN